MHATRTSSPIVPAGTWRSDPTHSSASFAVRHMGVATFRGRFERLDATLTADPDGTVALVGAVEVASVSVKDGDLAAHLLSPEFFDAERHPEIRFASRETTRDGDRLAVTGELTVKDHTATVRAEGTISGPVVALGDVEKVGVELETVIDRTEFGLRWNAPLPRGGVALADEVRLAVALELARAGS